VQKSLDQNKNIKEQYILDEHNYAYVSLEVANRINNFFKSKLDVEKEEVGSGMHSNDNWMRLAKTDVRALRR